MKTIVISGAATGIGAAVAEQQKNLGNRVIIIDLKDQEIVADLSEADSRLRAIETVKQLCPQGIDALVTCAGLGPNVLPLSLITQVNFFGAVELIKGLQPLLEKKQGSVVAVSSNSSAFSGLDESYISMLLEEDEEKACQLANELDGHNAYAGSKRALALWVRKNAPEMMRNGVRMNAVAPGMTTTPLTEKVMQDKTYGQAMKDFSKTIPSGQMATPDMIADSISYLLSEQAAFVCGSVLFVDGGQDALFRPEDY